MSPSVMIAILVVATPASAQLALTQREAEILSLSGMEQLRRLDAGTLTSEELVEAQLKRARQCAPLHIFAHLDEDRARREAARADLLREKGVSLGALHGLPVMVKDNIDTATSHYPTYPMHGPRIATGGRGRQSGVDGGQAGERRATATSLRASRRAGER
jgi:hypothetical protein